MRFLPCPFSSLWTHLRTLQYNECSPYLRILCTLLLRVHCVTSPTLLRHHRSLIDGSRPVTGCTLNSVPLIMSLHPAFFTYLLICSSNPCLTNSVIRKPWDTVLKAKCTSSKAPPLSSQHHLPCHRRQLGWSDVICAW